jgi:hypothetical protein
VWSRLGAKNISVSRPTRFSKICAVGIRDPAKRKSKFTAGLESRIGQPNPVCREMIRSSAHDAKRSRTLRGSYPEILGD